MMKVMMISLWLFWHTTILNGGFAPPFRMVVPPPLFWHTTILNGVPPLFCFFFCVFGTSMQVKLWVHLVFTRAFLEHHLICNIWFAMQAHLPAGQVGADSNKKRRATRTTRNRTHTHTHTHTHSLSLSLCVCVCVC